MKLAGYFNRGADLLFGIPLLLFGLSAVSTDVTAANYAAHGQRVFWAIGGGTIIGILPLLIGCRLIFRSPVGDSTLPSRFQTRLDHADPAP